MYPNSHGSDKHQFVAHSRKKRPAKIALARRFPRGNPAPFLKVQFQAKLKLSRIIGCSRSAVEAARAIALPEGIYVEEEGRRRGFVEAIEQVEAFSNHVQPDAFAKANSAHDPQIDRGVTMCNATIAAQAATSKRGRRHEERATVRDARAIIRALKITAGVSTGQDVKGASRRKFDDRGDSKI